jgi:hypothetical protein
LATLTLGAVNMSSASSYSGLSSPRAIAVSPSVSPCVTRRRREWAWVPTRFLTVPTAPRTSA